MPEQNSQALYIVLVSPHGLIRGHGLELGRDADTGGQTTYVVELARALVERPDVAQVDLLTRRVVDPRVSSDYAEPVEELGGGVRILRIDCGPEEYLRKEELWDHLDVFVDNALSRLRQEQRLPNLIHSHYADAGYVGVRLAGVLGLPLVHTGHSLGRVKRRRLLATGMKRDEIESRYQMARRIDAEEETLAAADLVVVSTGNEIDEQYGLYDFYRPEQMAVVPPGTDLQRFHAPGQDDAEPAIAAEIKRFLREPDKPMVLALSRPDERKNIATLVEAYGESADLQEQANLVLVTGNRDDLRDMDPGPQAVLQDLLLVIDYYDLYGRVAYPKHHKPEEVPEIYRVASASGGVFVNPALTEPFGLTLLEAAASGMPLVATEDGGPQDIIGNCRNGLLIDPLDKEAIAGALLRVLTSPSERRDFVANGLAGVHHHYSWQAHAESYLGLIRSLVERSAPPPRTRLSRRPMRYHDRAVFSDLDQTLLGDPVSLKDFTDFVRRNRKCASFGIATGRRLDSALKVMKRYRIPMPDVLITDVGTEIHYAPELTADQSWARHIDHQWQPKALRRVLDELPGLELQPKSLRTRFKLSYFIDPTKAPSVDELYRLLHQEEQAANLILSFGQYLDVLPVRASKGFALRYFSDRWDIPLEHILVAGGSGADEDMMRGNTLAVVVANRHHEELSQLTDIERIYFAREPYARGILDAIDHYDFYGGCRVPDADADADAD